MALAEMQVSFQNTKKEGVRIATRKKQTLQETAIQSAYHSAGATMY